MPANPVLRWLGVSSLWVYRMVTWAVVICGFVFALVVFGVRFWLLPNIENYRETIARELSAATKHRITIGRLEGRWSGFNLQLTLGELALYDSVGQPALKLARVDSTLSWWSLIHWEPRFDSIEIEHPDLNVRRDKRGVVSIAGIELNDSAGGEGLSDWLLRQQEIVIREAAITWLDEMRGADELAMQHVDFRLENNGKLHRFGLRAVPPEKIATPLDVRGELTGRTVNDLAQWNGQVFAQFNYTDIAAWRTWVQFPVSFPHGEGALRVWAELKNGEPAQITADVELSQVKTQLGKDLPDLELAALKGRIGWKQLKDGFEITTSKLSMTTLEHTHQPADFLLRYYPATASKPPHGELEANALDLEPLFKLADHLPFEPELRKGLDRFAPHGSVYDLTAKWSGSWPQPNQYTAKAKFVDVGWSASGRVPGFSGANGNIDGNERGGTLSLNTQHAAVELPLVFRDKLTFDTLAARVSWQRSGEQYEIKLDNVSFANLDVAGSVSGTYLTVPEGRGVIDLSGAVSRANARSVGRYIPLRVGERGRNWLEAALLEGTASDIKVRLKGNLYDFPFPEGKGGMFQVTAHVTGGVLDYASGWPRIENIDGDLTFRGSRMDIVARDASIMAAKLARVHAEIPDLGAADRVLTVSGDAEGQTNEFLNFIAKSPVADLLDRFTDKIQAEGSGKLALKLTIPVSNIKDTRVEGAYQFINNQLTVEGDLFPYEQVSGKLEFTESNVRVANATLNLLGGPATLSGATQKDGTVRLNLAGHANLDTIRRSNSAAWVQALHGAADWRAAVTLRKRLADIVFDSSLQGVVSDLPAPLAKTAADSLAFRLERRMTGKAQDRLVVSIGNIVSAQFQRSNDGNQYIIERGNISLGGSAAEPERKGLWISGSLKSFDLDQWLAVLKSASSGTTYGELGGIDVKFGTLDMFGRRFNDLAISGAPQGGLWQAVLIGREFTGEVSWRSQGKGKVVARMKNLVIPPMSPVKRPLATDKDQPIEFPALDIYADNLQVHQTSLGKLELMAVPDGRDWRLERLRVTNPDATLNIEGVWQGWMTQPRTMVNVRLDVSDIGKALVRLGYPEGIRRGTAKLEGPLSWSGNPSEIDYPTLSGNFLLEANKGQFVKLDPGIGKLLGVLSLQSLPRRLSLDFRDIFTDGLAFDEIVGTVKISRGVANTDSFRILGPAVRIQMTGDVDLNAETQKLRVKVFPSVSDSLSVAGAFVAGPIAGIAAFVAQKLLKDPLNQMAAYEYSVSGTWADPQVSKIDSGQEKSK